MTKLIKTMINSKTLKKLQLESVLQAVSGFAVSSVAKRKIMATVPALNLETEQILLKETAQGVDLFRYESSFDLSIDDVTEICSLAKVGSCLSAGQLLYVMHNLRTARLLQSSLFAEYPTDISLLQAKAHFLYADKQLEEDIDFAIISPDEINDKASSDLYAIRKRIKAINADIKQKLQSYTRSGELSKYLQDSIVTLRGDRYVIPVKQEYKSFVSGIVHDQSATGATVFVEPMAIVELNNNLRTALLDEKAEIQRILKAFSERVGAVADRIALSQDTVSDIDVIFSRVKYALANKCTEPIVNDNGVIYLKKARHPLLDSKKVVPVSVELGENYDIIVITAPNTGGKTVTLKTIGLMCVMAQCGLFIPCYDDSTVSYFDDIFCDIGDEQSIEQNLSTFSGHMTNIRDILNSCGKGSLVLIDEVGAGTEPNEGAALALAITDCLLKSGAKSVITTHYSRLKEYSLTTDRVENASMEFDLETLAPTYKLVMGVPGSSNAIAIAQKLGLRLDVVEFARKNVADDSLSFEKVLQNADVIRKEYEQKLADAEAERQKLAEETKRAQKLNDSLQNERNKLLAGSRDEAQKIVEKAREKADEVVAELKKLLQSTEISDKDLFNARSKAKELKNLSFEDENHDEDIIFTGDKVNYDKLAVGDVVYSKSLGVQVKVVEKREKHKVKVRSGAIETIVLCDDLYESVAEKNKNSRQRSQKAVHNTINTRSYHNEINVLGQTVDEAVANIDAFIDSALVAGFETVWVIHGNGTGRLRAGLHKYFSSHPAIKSFRLGEYGEGDSGVTVLTLK